jgi:glycosyltransferase involved in cell wall biosynthesis
LAHGPGSGELVVIAGSDGPRQVGGAQSYVIAQALAARHAGYHPHVFGIGPRIETVRTDYGTLHRVRSLQSSAVAHASAAHIPFLVGSIVRFLKDRPGPHVIQGHGGFAAAALLASSRLTRRGIRASSVATLYSSVWHEQVAKLERLTTSDHIRLRLHYALLLGFVWSTSVPLERRSYRRCDRVVVNYERVRELLADAYGPRADVVRATYAAPTAFDPDHDLAQWPAQTTADAGPPLILAVSRHSPRKGIDILIPALAELQRRGVAFRARLVGPGPMLEQHRELVAQLGLGACVEVPGFVPDVRPHLAECDLFVLPSTREDSGSVSVLEALQFARPIVAAAVDGIPEDLTHDQDAVLVAPGDVRALCDGLERMVRDEPLRRRLAAEGRRLYERRFSPAAAAADQAAIYTSLGLLPR